MICRIHVYAINYHFSQEYADEHNKGQESEMNRLYEWQDELEINENVEKVEEKSNDVFCLQGTLPTGLDFNEKVDGMHMVHIHCSSGYVNEIGCSESILDRIEVLSDEDAYIVSIWIKGNEPLANPIPGIYIAAQEFPKSLVF